MQSKGWLSVFSMAKINDLWDGSLDKRKVRGLVPCWGQDGNRAQVQQHSIDSYRYISILTLAIVLKHPYYMSISSQ